MSSRNGPTQFSPSRTICMHRITYGSRRDESKLRFNQRQSIAIRGRGIC